MITQLKKPTIRPQFLFALSFAGLLLAFVVNYFIFRYIFERSYLEWYLSAGPMIALATAAFGAAWGSLDKNPALISANPLTYFGACLQVAGLPLYSLGAHLKSGNRVEPVGIEVVPVSCLAILLTIAIFAWLLFIVLFQPNTFSFSSPALCHELHKHLRRRHPLVFNQDKLRLLNPARMIAQYQRMNGGMQV